MPTFAAESTAALPFLVHIAPDSIQNRKTAPFILGDETTWLVVNEFLVKLDVTLP